MSCDLHKDLLWYFRGIRQSLHVLWAALTRCRVQIGTTKGTGGDVLILEEAAYCDEGFFYVTGAPSSPSAARVLWRFPR